MSADKVWELLLSEPELTDMYTSDRREGYYIRYRNWVRFQCWDYPECAGDCRLTYHDKEEFSKMSQGEKFTKHD